MKLQDYTQKYSVVVMTRQGCPWCERLHSQTVPLLNAMGVRVMLTKSDRVRDQYKITAYPALIYLRGDKAVYVEEGFVAPQRVMEVMSQIEKGEYPDSEREYLDKKKDNAGLAEKVTELMRDRGIEPPRAYAAEPIPDPWEENPE